MVTKQFKGTRAIVASFASVFAVVVVLQPELAVAQSCSVDDSGCVSTSPGDDSWGGWDVSFTPFTPVGGYGGGYSPGGTRAGSPATAPPDPATQWNHAPPTNWTPADAVNYTPGSPYGAASAPPTTSEMQSVMSTVSRTLPSSPYSRPLATSMMEANGSDPVHDGELVIQDVDLRFPGHQLDFEFRRTYRSRVHHLSPLGWGWDHNFNRKIVTSNRCGDVAVTTGDSGRVAFTQTSTNSAYTIYQPADAVPLTLVKVLNAADHTKDAWKLRDGLGKTYVFDSRGLLASIADSAGNTIAVEWELAPQTKALDPKPLGTYIDTPFYFRSTEPSGRIDSADPLGVPLADDDVDVHWRVSKVTDTTGREIHLVYDHAFLKCLTLTADCTSPLVSFEVNITPTGNFWKPTPALPGQPAGVEFDWKVLYRLQHYGELNTVHTPATVRSYSYDETEADEPYLPDDLADAFCHSACGLASDCHATAVCDLPPGEAQCETTLSKDLAGKPYFEAIEACISSMLSVGGCQQRTAETAGYHYPQVQLPFCGTAQSLNHKCLNNCTALIGANGIWSPASTKGWSDGQLVDQIGKFCNEYCVDSSTCANIGASIPGICQALIKRSIPFCGNGDCFSTCRSRYQLKDSSGTAVYAYGGIKDLRHNLLVIKDGNGRVVQQNDYGRDPADPAFDKVVTQQLGESSKDRIAFYYYDYKNDRWTADRPASILQILQWAGDVPIVINHAGSALLETAVGAPSGGLEHVVAVLRKVVKAATDPLSTFIDSAAGFDSVLACPAYCVKKKPAPVVVPVTHIPPPIFLGPSLPGATHAAVTARGVSLTAAGSDISKIAAPSSSTDTVYGLLVHVPISQIPPSVLWPPPGAIDLKPGDVCAQWSYSPAWTQSGAANAHLLPVSAVVVADLHGVVRSEYYDASGRLLREVNHHYSDKQTKEVTQYNYDSASGGLQGVQFADGSRLCTETDSLGRPLQQTRVPAPAAPGGAQPAVKLLSYGAYVSTPAFAPDLTDVVVDPTSAVPKSTHFDWDSGRLAKVRVQVDASQADVTQFSYLAPVSGLAHPSGYYQSWAPTSVTHPDGSAVHFEAYGITGPQTVRLETAAGEWFTNDISYDVNGRPAEMHRHSHVGGTETGYDLAGRPTVRGQRNKSGNWIATSYGYDGVHEGPTTIDGPTSTTTLSYDSLGHLRWMAEVSKLKDVPGRATCWSYAADGRLESVLRPEGNLTNYYYDDAGRLVRKEAGYPAALPDWTASCISDLKAAGLPVPNTAGHSADLQIVQLIHYDNSGRPDQIVDGSGVGALIVNDGLGRPIDVIDGMGNHRRRGYDARGRVIWEATLGPNPPDYAKPQAPTTTLRTMVEYAYDNLDRIVEVDRWHFANGQWVNPSHPKATTTIVYDDAHATVSVSKDGDPPTVTQLDDLGRVVERTLPNKNIEKFVYAENGTRGERVVHSFTGADGTLKTNVSYYNDYGTLLEVDDDANTPLVVNSLDDENRVWTQSSGRIFSGYEFDGFGRIAAFHQGTGSTARKLLYTWDSNDRMRSVRDANQALTTYFYNGLDLKSFAQHPANGTSTWNYIPGSARLHDYTDPFGTKEVFGYDPAGRLYSEHRTNGSLLLGDGVDRIFTYTPANLLETATVEGNLKNPANGSIVSFGYDSLGNRIFEDSSLSPLTISQVWGPHSGPTQTVLYPRNSPTPMATVSREFDSLGRLQHVNVNQTLVATFEHEAGAGRVDYGKQGIASMPTYDHRGRLVGLDVLQGTTTLARLHDAVGVDGIVRERQRQFGASQPLTSFYAVDDAGRVTDENNGLAAFAVLAEPAADLTDKDVRPYFDDPSVRGTTFRSYSLDGLANWISRTDAQGTTNSQFTTATGLDQYYADPTGETWNYQAGAATQVGSNTFSFDVLGQLEQATTSGDNLQFTYDALGRRVVEQHPDGWTIALVWNGSEVLALGVGTTPQRYELRIGGESGDETIAIAQELGSGPVTYLHPGMDGSTLAATRDSGLVEGYAYTAFGEPSFFDGVGRPSAGSTIGNRFLFQGQLYDPSLGAYAMRAREYLPRAGRFVSPDPIGIAGGENIYAFCLGKPLFLSDPFGLSPFLGSAGGAPIRLSVNGRDVFVSTPTLHIENIDHDIPMGDVWRYTAPPTKLPQFEEVVVNTLVTAPMHVMAPFFSGSEQAAAQWEQSIQSVRPFPYAADQQALGSGLESSFVTMASVGASIASSADGAVGAFRTASLARNISSADVESAAASTVEEETALASRWPPNRGFLGEPTTDTLNTGSRISRYGSPNGNFASPEGVSFEERALHPSSLEKPYHVYEVTKPFDVKAGRAMPWFGYSGLGIQYELPESIESLLEGGFLREVH